MNLLGVLQRSGGIEGLARQVDVSVDRVKSHCENLMPPLMLAMQGYVRRQGGGNAGVEALMELVARHGGGGLAASVMGERGADAAGGKAMLATLFAGREDEERKVAGLLDAPQADPAVPERLFALLAMLVAGYMAAQVGGSGAQGSGGIEALGPIRAFLLSDDEYGADEAASGSEGG